MTPEIPYQTEIALTIVRVVAGILFLFQGYDKLFTVGLRGVYNTFHEPMSKKNIPGWILWACAWFTTVVELAGGILLIAGLLTPWVAIFLLLDLLLVIIAFSLLEPMWDMRHIFPRLVLLLVIVLTPFGLNIFSIDYLLFK